MVKFLILICIVLGAGAQYFTDDEKYILTENKSYKWSEELEACSQDYLENGKWECYGYSFSTSGSKLSAEILAEQVKHMFNSTEKWSIGCAKKPFQIHCTVQQGFDEGGNTGGNTGGDVENEVTPVMDEAKREEILRVHNEYRNKVACQNEPRQLMSGRASNMYAMSWDESLAKNAEKWAKYMAKNNFFGHDDGDDRKIGTGFKWVGQNLAYFSNSAGISCNWTEAIEAWYEEVKDCLDNRPANMCESDDPKKPVGHYTQVVWGTSNQVGCGYGINGGKIFYACNYGPGGNYIGQPLFETGERDCKKYAGFECLCA